MITLRKSNERGQFDHGWLKTHHTFSFADYHDPRYMGFSSLRVINDDQVAPSEGFDTHPHRNMEIVTYVLSGELAHRDSMGTGSVIRPGEVQRMSAGTGVLHSEFNHSQTEWVHLLQIWIVPEKNGIQPGYEQKAFPLDERRNRFRLVASRDGREGSVTIHQDAAIYVGVIEDNAKVEMPILPGRKAWVHAARGDVEMNGLPMSAGDGAAVENESVLRFIGRGTAEVLVFDLS